MKSSRKKKPAGPASIVNKYHYLAALLAVKELTRKGYTPEKAEKESHWGMSGPNTPGFSIQKGWITVPMLTGSRFRFRSLTERLAGMIRKPAPPTHTQLTLPYD